MVHKNIRELRNSLFPEVTDWKDPKHEVRYTKRVKDLSWKDWLFFHPSAYKLVIYYGVPSCSFIAGLFLVSYSYFKGYSIGLVLGLILSILFGYRLAYRYIHRWQAEMTNISDVLLKEG